MSSIVIAGDTSGSVTLQAPAVAGSTVLNLPSTSGTIQTSGAGYTTNGVAYATSATGLATGSALTFDGTNLGVGGSPANVINAKSATQYKGVQVNNATNTIAELIGFNASNEAGGLKLYNAGNPIVQILSDGTSFLNGGNVGIGTTSPSYKGQVTATVASGGGGWVFGVQETTRQGGLVMGSYGATNSRIGAIQGLWWGNAAANLLLNPDGGNVGIGLSSSLSTGLSVNGSIRSQNDASNISYLGFTAYTGTGASGLMYSYIGGDGRNTGYLTFNTVDAERARIDSSGNFLVGTTTGDGKIRVVQSASQNTGFFRNSNSTTVYGIQVEYNNRVANSVGEEFIYCGDTSPRFVARSNGGLANYSGNNVNLSDRREKTNFAPAKSYLDVICAIPVQTFNYIDQNLEEDGGLTLGVVAQDVQAVAPELVMESNWANRDQDPKMRLSIYQTDLQYALMKCIQELKAEFDAYKASHP